MEKLHSLEYADGYRNALMDVLETLKNIDVDMKIHKRKRTAKEYTALIQCMLENRIILRENIDAFVRCSSNGGYEVYDSKLNKVVKT